MSKKFSDIMGINWKDRMFEAVMHNRMNIAVSGFIITSSVAMAFYDNLMDEKMQQDSNLGGVMSMSVQELRDSITVPHYAKIAGIADELREDGVAIPSNLDIQIRFASRLAEVKYTQYEDVEGVQVAYDMARSEGELEARNGDWSIEQLSIYVEEVMALDDRFVQVADAAVAYLQDEGMSADEANHYVRQSIGLSYFDHNQLGPRVIDGDDDRMEFLSEGHRGVVSDLHIRMHKFFQDRLENLEVSDQLFILDLNNDLLDRSVPVIDEIPTPTEEFDI
jgi:hypothetical protein